MASAGSCQPPSIIVKKPNQFADLHVNRPMWIQMLVSIT